MESESAISRNIILALVVSVVIIIVAAVIVMIVFPPQPDVVPQFSANTEKSGNTVYIYHDGGDPLTRSRTLIKINGEQVADSAITFLHGQDWPWTAGKTIRVEYSGQGSPETVQVIYSSGSRQALLYSTSLGGATGIPIPITTVITPVTTLLPQTPFTSSVTPEVTTKPSGTFVPEPPIAGFVAVPRSGPLPLSVQFTDTSTGTPTTWLWNFGDGASDTIRNPVHLYQKEGSYTVTLSVSNNYGSGRKTETDYIAVGLIPSSNFAAVPREGTAPLEVQFSDLSSGMPDHWEWTFGDGASSSQKNPVHTYARPGSFTVTLTASNRHGSNTRIQTNYVRITEPDNLDIQMSGSHNGYLLPDGYFQFLVKGGNAWIKIGGPTYTFNDGDLVQLFPGTTENGVIDVNANGITTFSFSDVRMYVNGAPARSGIVSGISVPGFEGLKSTLTIYIPPGNTDLVMFVDGQKIFNPSGQAISIINLATDSDGRLAYTDQNGIISYRGGAERYTLT